MHELKLPENVYKKVNHIETLATLPHIASDILELTRRAKSSIKEIARVMERDVSVTAKIIRISNSPLWGYPSKIDNIHRAIVLLGLKEVLNIVIAVSLYSTFSKIKPNPLFDRNKFWLHCAGTGLIARSLSKKLGLSCHGKNFVAALTHDIGKIVLDQFMNDEFQKTLIHARESGKQIIDAEEEVLNCNHAEIGGWLLKHWNFPETIYSAVYFHHSPGNANTYKELSAVVQLSDTICEYLGFGFDNDIGVDSLDDSPGWKIIKMANSQLDKVDIKSFVDELRDEIEQAQLFLELISD